MFSLIESELERTGLERNRLIFEVTESAAFQDIGRAIEFIDRIKALGCRIALDDFGVGFSSFSYLKQLQADILKIDGSFIREIHHSKHDQLFVKALVDVARGMGMKQIEVSSKGESTISIPIALDFTQIGVTVYQILSGDDTLEYSLKGALDVGSSLSLLQQATLPLNTSGLLEIQR